MFSRTFNADTRLNAWKTKPIRVRRSFVNAVSDIFARSVPASHTVPVARPVQPGGAVQQRALARTGRPHHRRERAAAEVEVDAVERTYGRAMPPVRLPDASQ